MNHRPLCLLIPLLLLLTCPGCIFSQAAQSQGEISPPAHLSKDLKTHVTKLSGELSPRSAAHEDKSKATVNYIASALQKTGATVTLHPFITGKTTRRNVSAIIPGASAKRIIIGAHYDAAPGSPGADDNASGVAGLIELAKLLKGAKLNHTIELVAYATEEPPFFGTADMGSARHAQRIYTEQIGVKLMICLEMIGYFSDKEHSQNYPVGIMKALYPTKGNFIAIVGNTSSITPSQTLQTAIQAYIPTVRINIPGAKKLRLDLSDHRNYWAKGFPAVMITDTSFYRNPHYHKATDRASTLNYHRMASVVSGLYQAILALDKHP